MASELRQFCGMKGAALVNEMLSKKNETRAVSQELMRKKTATSERARERNNNLV